jgi:hypothetical protein
MSVILVLAAAAFAQTAPAQTVPVEPVIVATTPVDPARSAAAERVANALVPPGTYKRIMRDQFPQLMDGIVGQMFGLSAKTLRQPAAAGDKTLGQEAAERDPYFRERMKITMQVFADEMSPIYDEIEPEFRAGLAKAFARRFTLQQLGDQDAFFRTPSGRAFANDYLATFMDPEVMRSMMGAMPRLFKVMPTIAAKIEKATAHLPPPPSKAGASTTGKAK